MADGALFRTRRETESPPASAEDVFRTLKPTTNRVRHLWSHQADILRAYDGLPRETRDVAMELPTGAGKTMVGLLVAEFRRRTLGQRVAYLCPTVQLAGQVADQARDYGLSVSLLTGPQANYVAADYNAYSRAERIAVTTYHALFNVNPRINDAQTLVFDDAHSAEPVVAGLWTLSAKREEDHYRPLLDLLATRLPRAFAERLADDGIDPVAKSYVEICGPHDLAPIARELRDVLNANQDAGPLFAARMILDALPFCMAYLSWRQIEIRPFVAPTSWHLPFAGAAQHVYMSATLGAAGELERAFGVRRIHRLPMPRGWEEQGSGRRFFMFPSASLEADEVDGLVRAAITEAGRALALTPSNYELEAFAESCVPANVPRRTAANLGEVDPFGGPIGALLLANRYDGIDLPDEECRLIILSGLPSGSHLQERFLWERLGARRVLAERIRTRILQGSGRCTRNVQDYAAVIIRGNELTDYLSRRENSSPMLPEVQAEVEFGFENAENDATTQLAMLRAFLAQDANWLAADPDIEGRISSMPRQIPPDSERLARSAPREVEAWEAAWRGDHVGAAAAARQAADELEGGAEIRPYQCFWLYLAASFATAGAQTEEDEFRAAAMREETAACARSIAWRPRFDPGAILPRPTVPGGFRGQHAAAALVDWGTRGSRFERLAADLLEMLKSPASNSFERGLDVLGPVLGFEATRPPGEANPDGAWRDDHYWFIFEAKTEEDEARPISATTVRQALTHEDWAAANLGWELPDQRLTIVVTPKARVDPTAKQLAGKLVAASQHEIVELAESAVAIHRRLRLTATAMSAEELATALETEFERTQLGTDAIALRFLGRPIAHMPS